MQTISYHPQSNGMVDRFHRQLKTALCARRTGWTTCLGCFWSYVQHPRRKRECRQWRPLMAIRWCCPASCNCLGVHHRLFQLRWRSQHREVDQGSREGMQCGGQGGFSHVRAARHLVPWPYCMLVRERKKLLLEIGATQTWISVYRLKPHTGAAAPAVAQLPPRVQALIVLYVYFCPPLE